MFARERARNKFTFRRLFGSAKEIGNGPNFHQFDRFMLQNTYEDCSACHIEIKLSVISFDIPKTLQLQLFSTPTGLVMCFSTDVEHFVALRCPASPISCTEIGQKHPGSHLSIETDSLVSGLVGCTLGIVSGASGYLETSIFPCGYFLTTTEAFR